MFQRSDPTRGIIKKKFNRLYTQYQNFPYEFRILHKTVSTAQFDRIKNKTSKTQEDNKLNLFKSTASFRECFPNQYLMLEHTNSDRVPFVIGQQQTSLVPCEPPASSSHMTGKLARLAMPHALLRLRAIRTYPFFPQSSPQLQEQKQKTNGLGESTLLHAEYDNMEMYYFFFLECIVFNLHVLF